MTSGVYEKFARWLSNGELHLNAWLLLADPGVAEAFASSSFDSVTFDLQHGQAGVTQMIACIAAVALAGKPALVRVPLRDYSLSARALDAGARGVIFPMVESPEEARMLVEATKYAPVGARSWGAYRGFAMSGLSPIEFLKTENRSNAIFAMIETARGLAHAESILATPGLDGLFIGPNDLCISLTEGREVRTDHPLVEAACLEVVSMARRYGKLAGIYASSTERARVYAKNGFNFIAMGNDVGFLRAKAEAVVGEVRG